MTSENDLIHLKLESAIASIVETLALTRLMTLIPILENTRVSILLYNVPLTNGDDQALVVIDES